MVRQFKWREITTRNKFASFLDALLKGYGQVLICLNPITGFLLAAVIFFFSRTVGCLSLSGVLVSTLTAIFLRAKDIHIKNGVYGFNGVILGIAWTWFLKVNCISLLLFICITCLSSVIIMSLIQINSKTRVNLPFLSVPSVLLIWLMVIFFKYFAIFSSIAGPDQGIVLYLENFQANFFSLTQAFSFPLFLKTFSQHLIVLFCIWTAIAFHSRLSFLFAFLFFFVTLMIVYILGGALEFQNIEFYLYNTIPCGIALSGTFLVLTRPVVLLSLLGVILCAVITFLGLHFSPFPVFVFPFNFVTILFIWLVKSGWLKREQEFLAVPMDFVSTPEVGLSWLKGEVYAENYWREIERMRYK